MSKVVLVGYLERKKRITIEEKRTENELDYLKEEFLKSFSLDVDIEEGDVLLNEDKLKVVVSPCLLDTIPKSSAAVLACDENQRLHAGEVAEVEVNLHAL